MKFNEAMDLFGERVEKACRQAGHMRCRVEYSNYDYDGGDLDTVRDNLDQVAVEGKVIFWAAADDFFGGPKSRDYVSEVVESPTWLQVCVLANAMIASTRDTHHCYLEGVQESYDHTLGIVPQGVKVYGFQMGS